MAAPPKGEHLKQLSPLNHLQLLKQAKYPKHRSRPSNHIHNNLHNIPFILRIGALPPIAWLPHGSIQS